MQHLGGIKHLNRRWESLGALLHCINTQCKDEDILFYDGKVIQTNKGEYSFDSDGNLTYVPKEGIDE